MLSISSSVLSVYVCVYVWYFMGNLMYGNCSQTIKSGHLFNAYTYHNQILSPSCLRKIDHTYKILRELIRDNQCVMLHQNNGYIFIYIDLRNVKWIIVKNFISWFLESTLWSNQLMNGREFKIRKQEQMFFCPLKFYFNLKAYKTSLMRLNIIMECPGKY